MNPHRPRYGWCQVCARKRRIVLHGKCQNCRWVIGMRRHALKYKHLPKAAQQ